MDSEIYKLLGPISILLTGLAIAFMIYKWPGSKGMSISRHSAANNNAYVLMLVVQSITLPMLFLFLTKWLAPNLELPTLFTVFASFACLGLLIAAWVPDTIGWKSIVHGFAGYGAAILIVPLLTMLYLAPIISSFSKNMALAVLIYEIIAITIFFTLDKAKDVYLYLQTVYIFLFAFTTLAAAYIT